MPVSGDFTIPNKPADLESSTATGWSVKKLVSRRALLHLRVPRLRRALRRSIPCTCGVACVFGAPPSLLSPACHLCACDGIAHVRALALLIAGERYLRWL